MTNVNEIGPISLSDSEDRVLSRAESEVPLVVDLDGTLIRSDLLIESGFAYLGHNPLRLFSLLAIFGKGKALLKAVIAAQATIDVTHLPYDERVLGLMDEARRQGREVYIASASNERYVAAVANHVGADGWFASDSMVNLSREQKARRLVETFGKARFDYVGNDSNDVPVWSVCRRGWAIHPPQRVRATFEARGYDVTIISPPKGRLGAWIKLIRVHQWAKNALALVPLLTAQKFDIASLIDAVGAIVAFSFAASAVYIVNDLVDLDADRKHPSKKHRPLAAGTVPILAAFPAALALLVLAFVLALIIAPPFAVVLLTYLVLTTAYTFFFKRKMLVDIVILAALYTIRVIGGAAAIAVPVSEWLLAFSMFIFTSLALIKRYVELTGRLDADLPDPSNRNYKISDLDVV